MSPIHQPIVKTWILTLGLFLSAAHPTSAAFGDSADTLDSRYGAPTNTSLLFDDCEKRSYLVGGLVLNVILWNGLSHFEEWAGIGVGEPLSETRVYTLLNANKNGSQWDLRDYSEKIKTWQRASDHALAIYDVPNSRLRFWTKEFSDEMEKRKKVRSRSGPGPYH